MVAYKILVSARPLGTDWDLGLTGLGLGLSWVWGRAFQLASKKSNHFRTKRRRGLLVLMPAWRRGYKILLNSIMFFDTYIYRLLQIASYQVSLGKETS